MSKRGKKTPPAPEPPKPVDVVDGLPDRSGGSSRRIIVLIVVIFSAWVAFLVYCRLAGAP